MLNEALQGAGSGLVERDAELARLAELAERAARGEGTVALLEAAAGTGKTALVRASLRHARPHGFEVRAASGSEIEADSPFGVVRQLFDPLILLGSTSERDALFEGVAGLARPVFGLPDDRPGPAGAGAEVEQGVLHGLFWLVARLASRRPLMLAIDDVHWADEPSQRFLAFLARRSEGLELLMLLAGRPGAAGSGSATLAESLRAVGAEHIRPAALSAAGVARLVERRLGRPPAPGFTAACLDVTRGNPFYVEALLDELVDRSVAPEEEGAETVRKLTPASVGRVVRRTTARLPAGAYELLQAVAVLGDGHRAGLAARLAGIDASTSLPAVVRALAAEALLEAGDHLTFVHPIARAAVYEELTADGRAARHAAAVALLRATAAGLEPIATQLLRTAPGAVADAAATLERAAQAATRRGAPEIAVRCLRRALRESLDAARRSAIGLALAEAAVSARLPEAEELLRAAIEPTSSTEHRVEAAAALARLLLMSGRTSEAADALIALADELVQTAPAAASFLELELLTVADIDLSVRPQLEDRLQRAARRATGCSPASAPLLLAHRSIEALRRCTGAKSAAELAEAALGDAHPSRSIVTRSLLRPLLLYVLISAERYEEAGQRCAEMLEVATVKGSARLFVDGAMNHALMSFRTGRLSDSEAEARQALDVATLNDWQPLQLLALMGLVDTTLASAGPAAAGSVFAQAPVDLDAIGSAQAAAVLFSRGVLRVASGSAEAGCADLLDSGARFEAWGMINPAVSPWRSEAALALAALGERGRALALSREEVELARRWGTARPLGVALRAQGLVESGEAGLAALAEAVAVLETSAARLEHGRALIDLGAARRRAGRRSEARVELRLGIEIAQACGAGPLARQGRVELRVAGGRTRAPLSTGVDALTASEARIAAMAARGRSNTQIAQELFLTSKTIEMHLSGAYRKLGIASRRELPAALADPAPNDDPVFDLQVPGTSP